MHRQSSQAPSFVCRRQKTHCRRGEPHESLHQLAWFAAALARARRSALAEDYRAAHARRTANSIFGDLVRSGADAVTVFEYGGCVDIDVCGCAYPTAAPNAARLANVFVRLRVTCA